MKKRHMFGRFLLLVSLTMCMLSVISHLLYTRRQFVVDNARLGDLVSSVVQESGGSGCVDEVLARLQDALPHDVCLDAPPLFRSRVGSAPSMLRLLQASLAEYLVLWGSPLPSAGYSGWYAGESMFFVVRGRVDVWDKDVGEVATFNAGASFPLDRFKVVGVHLYPDTWILHHFIGVTPLSLPFSLLDVLHDAASTLQALLLFATWTAHDLVSTMKLWSALGSFFQ